MGNKSTIHERIPYSSTVSSMVTAQHLYDFAQQSEESFHCNLVGAIKINA